MSDILDRIDAAIGCQQCGGPLRDSPSDDFCGEGCQEVWQGSQVGVEVEPEWNVIHDPGDDFESPPRAVMSYVGEIAGCPVYADPATPEFTIRLLGLREIR